LPHAAAMAEQADGTEGNPGHSTPTRMNAADRALGMDCAGTNELYDPDWSQRADAPWVVGRQRFGRIAISNSDAAATSLTSAAFAQSHRAVMELVNDIVRPVYD